MEKRKAWSASRQVQLLILPVPSSLTLLGEKGRREKLLVRRECSSISLRIACRGREKRRRPLPTNVLVAFLQKLGDPHARKRAEKKKGKGRVCDEAGVGSSWLTML